MGKRTKKSILGRQKSMADLPRGDIDFRGGRSRRVVR